MKKLLIATLILILIIVVFLVGIKFKPSNNKEDSDIIPTPTIILPTISENISVDLYSKDNKRSVVLKIDGLTSIMQSIEYEMIYMTGSGLPRGVNGKIILKDEKKIIRDNITLGSCSTGGKCTFDEGVKSIDLTLKFNSSSGASVFQKTYPL